MICQLNFIVKNSGIQFMCHANFIMRNSVRQLINEVNKFKKEVSIDDLFHLFSVCTLDDGTMVRFEKNAEIEIIKISKIQQTDKSNIFECVVPNNISLNELFVSPAGIINKRFGVLIHRHAGSGIEFAIFVRQISTPN